MRRAQRQTEFERTAAESEKTGVFLGSYVINRVNGEKVPIWIADYVLPQYGTGAVMGVPAHDQRDFDIRQKIWHPHQDRGGSARLGRQATLRRPM